MTGFFTREIREGGRRVGFAIDTLDGKRGILAHRKPESPVRLGTYRVNLGDIARVAVPAMVPESPDQIVLIDEIGRMECFSSLFRETLVAVLDSPNRVVGSIALKGDQFIEGIKKRHDVVLVPLAGGKSDRDQALQTLVKALHASAHSAPGTPL
jgi:nucleoside-triphosphatase